MAGFENPEGRQDVKSGDGPKPEEIDESWVELAEGRRGKKEDAQEAEQKAKVESLDHVKKEIRQEKFPGGQRKDDRAFDPTHPNPFWREQEELLTPGDRFADEAVGAVQGAYRRIKGFFQPFRFRENPYGARRRQKKYELMVSHGEAEYLGQSPKLSYADYTLMRRTYRRSRWASDAGHYFDAVGIYREDGRFTGRVKVYKIKKRSIDDIIKQ